MLYRPGRHEPLTERAWGEAWVSDAVAVLAGDAVRAHDPATLWPIPGAGRHRNVRRARGVVAACVGRFSLSC